MGVVGVVCGGRLRWRGQVGVAGRCCVGQGVVDPGRFGWLLVGVEPVLGEGVDVLVGLV